MRIPSRPRARSWISGIVAVSLCVWLLRNSDLGGGLRALARVGPALLLAFIPWICTQSLDTLGWRAIFRFLGSRPSFLTLLHARLRAEAVIVSVPGGAVLAEPMVPLLLEQRGLPIARSVAASAGRKWMLTRAQAIYIVISGLAGWSCLSQISPRLVRGGALPCLVLASALLPLAVSTLIQTLFDGARVERMAAALSRSNARLGRWLAQRRDGFARADEELSRLSSLPLPVLLRAQLCWICAWLCEACETWLLLHLVGAQLELRQCMAFEAALSLLRSVAFFAPGGLGVQDAGYLIALQALAVPGAEQLGPAFILLKRGKELFWAGIGWALLIAGFDSPKAAARLPEQPISPDASELVS